MPIRDAQLDLSPDSSDIPLTTTLTVMSGSTLDLGATPTQGLAVRLDLEHTHGSTDASITFLATVHAASSTPVTSSDPIVGQMDTTYAPQTTANTHRQFIIPFHVPTNYRYVGVEFAVAGASSFSPSWSVVEAFVTTNVQEPWQRSHNNFD